jgi:hypothetical protein
MSEWVNVENKIPNISAGKFMVKTTNGNVLESFFYRDQMGWISFYGKKPTHWWDSTNGEPIYNVSHWKTCLKD